MAVHGSPNGGGDAPVMTTGGVRATERVITSGAMARKPADPSDAPPSLGGSPVVLQLRVEDVDVVFGRMRDAGASVVFPVVEFCGERMGRVRDPFGHLWIVSERTEELPPEEIQRRRDTWTLSSPSSKA
jgi:uncharacterized glyoxalase superfamily protein PhnB